uniref:AlNc14C39G3386 protein n=1 Tax=Albugo laibachii Nc14 TaxID=890382 RepID=F0W9B9_9STRA|nr:AlNc14C39G3386 [Albugo laibachii Nc14]CCA18378.1 AlNc14C49G3911 [Albugo laibachii Nc14]|eukprot:CCA18378.1 AlNc14C49G3911 [Albugo laibachii Nc14]
MEVYRSSQKQKLLCNAVMQTDGNASSIQANEGNETESDTVSNLEGEIDKYERCCDAIIQINESLISLSRNLDRMIETTGELNQFTSNWLHLWSLSKK